MDIQTASINMNQAKIQEQAAVQVQAMGLSAAKEQGAALTKLLGKRASDNRPQFRPTDRRFRIKR